MKQLLTLLLLPLIVFGQSTSQPLSVHKTTGAIVAPVVPATFKSANNIGSTNAVNTWASSQTFSNAASIKLGIANSVAGGIEFFKDDSGFSFTLYGGNITANRALLLPDASGTLAIRSGDLGTPTVLVGTNISGSAASLTAGNVTTNANLTGDVTSSGNVSTVAGFSRSIVQTTPTLTITANAGVIDVTKIDQKATNNAATTLTFSGTPATSNTVFGATLSNSDTTARVWTIPSSFSRYTNGFITSVTVPAAVGGNNSELPLRWKWDGARYNLDGDPPSQTGTGSYVLSSGATFDATNATSLPHSVSFTVDGGGAALTTGVQAVIVNALYAGTVSSWTVTASPADTITFDILRSAAGGAAPSTSMVGAGTKPALASGVDANSAPASWTSTAITARDNFKCQITAVGGTATSATVTLYYK